MGDSPQKQKENRQNEQAERIRQMLRDAAVAGVPAAAGLTVSANTQNRVRYTMGGREFYFEVEELEA